MRKWLMTTVAAVAVACGGSALHAQQPAEPDPALQPSDEQLREARERAAQEKQSAEEAMQEARKHMELRLRAVTEQQRAAAAQAADLARGMRAARGQMEKASWLGVATSKVPQALRQHLDLQHKYIGLVVERVEPDSPAAQAGLQQFDIVERVNDQWIVNTEQFSVVLRMHEPGTEVNLSIIRKGKPQDVKVTLAEKELPVLGMHQFEVFELPALGAAGGFGAGGVDFFQVAPEGRVIIRDAAGFDPLVQFRRVNEAKNAQIVVTDSRHSLKITTSNGSRHLEASDPNGVVFFEGPINTEEELDAVPEEIREKVRDLQAEVAAPEPGAVARPHNE